MSNLVLWCHSDSEDDEEPTGPKRRRRAERAAEGDEEEMVGVVIDKQLMRTKLIIVRVA